MNEGEFEGNVFEGGNTLGLKVGMLFWEFVGESSRSLVSCLVGV